MSIFISHSSKDEFFINQFVKKILIDGCGLSDEQIFCTSIDGLGIKTGDDFRQRIRENLINADFSFIMISENYKRSEVCLNEMGASWALDGLRVRQYLFPNLGFDSLGVLLNVQQAAKIDESSALDELFEEITKHFNTSKKTSIWNNHKADFLSFLKEYMQENSNQIYPSPKDYFESFVKENASLNHLLLKAHPTLLDCKMIFHEKYYKQFFEIYCKMFADIEKEYMEPIYPKKRHLRIVKSNTMELMNGINNIAGGMVLAAKNGYFNYGVDFYEVTFLENENSEFGLSYKVFCFVNDRWIFIPKPWRYLR